MLNMYGGRGHGKSISYQGKLRSPPINIKPYTIWFPTSDPNVLIVKRSKKSMATKFCAPRFDEGVYRVQWDRQEDSNVPGVMMGDLNIPMDDLLARMVQIVPEEGHMSKSKGYSSYILPNPPKYNRRSNLLRILRNDYNVAYSWDRRYRVPIPKHVHEQIVDMFLEQIKPLGL